MSGKSNEAMWRPIETAKRGPIYLFDPAEPMEVFWACPARGRSPYEVRFGWELRESVLSPKPPLPFDITRPQWMPAQ